MDVQVLDPEQARQVVEAALEGAGASLFDLVLTPPFPERWPAPAGSEVVCCAYRTKELPTGQVRYSVFTPELEIAFAPTVAGAGATRVRRLDARKLDRTESREPVQADSDLAAAARSLFAVVTSGGTDDDRARLHAAHRIWLEEHPVIAGALEERFPDYVRWLRGPGP